MILPVFPAENNFLLFLRNLCARMISLLIFAFFDGFRLFMKQDSFEYGLLRIRKFIYLLREMLRNTPYQ